MLDVALWSKFPSYYSEGRIAPKLLARGFRVTRHLTPNVSSDTDLSGVAVVLFLSENAGHADFDRIRTIVNSQNKKLVALSRKESFWGRDLSSLEQMKMAAQKAIPDEKLEEFCQAYVELAKRSMTHEQMIHKLQKFWKNGKLTNAGQLSQYIRSMIAGGRAPKWFVGLDEQMKRERREQKFAQEQAMEEMATSDMNAVALSRPSEIPVRPAKSEKSDLELMEDMYKEEMDKLSVMNTRLVNENADLQKKVIDTNRKVEHQEQTIVDLKNRTGNLPKVGDTKLNLALKNLIESVGLGLNSKEEAFDRLADFYKKSMG